MTDLILGFIEANAEWAIVLVFLIAFAESLAIIGLMIPGWLILVGIGGMIGADRLSFYPVVISAYLGAVSGEYLSFHLGYYYHKAILNWPFVAKHQKLIDSSHEFFRKHGVGGVFIGRFFGPTRAIVPFIAGVSEMSKRTFFWVNCLSGLLWAPLYLIPGILIGAAFNLEKQQSSLLLLNLMIVLVSLLLAANYIKRYIIEKSSRNSLLLTKVTLSITICALVTSVFVNSPYWELTVDILKVLLSKL